jgi:hypothetical protein
MGVGVGELCGALSEWSVRVLVVMLRNLASCSGYLYSRVFVFALAKNHGMV